MEFKIRVPAIRPLLLPLVLITGLAAFMALDKTTLHWYVPEGPQQVEKDVQSLEADVSRLASRVGTVENVVNEPPAPVLDEGDIAQVLQIRRLTNAVAILSLVQANGGFQTTTSPAGKACIAFLLSGAGSVTDCGFEHVE